MSFAIFRAFLLIQVTSDEIKVTVQHNEEAQVEIEEARSKY